jgi:hypothetical protein
MTNDIQRVRDDIWNGMTDAFSRMPDMRAETMVAREKTMMKNGDIADDPDSEE